MGGAGDGKHKKKYGHPKRETQMVCNLQFPTGTDDRFYCRLMTGFTE